MKLLSIRSLIDISSHSRGFHSLSVACCESNTGAISNHCAALVQKGGIAILCDDIYDELPQILCLYFMVSIQKPAQMQTLFGFSVADALQTMRSNWKSASLSDLGVSFPGWKMDVTQHNFYLKKSSQNILKLVQNNNF